MLWLLSNFPQVLLSPVEAGEHTLSAAGPRSPLSLLIRKGATPVSNRVGLECKHASYDAEPFYTETERQRGRQRQAYIDS